MEGTKIGAYRVDTKLGEGGMGVVYRATDTELDRTVAIKTLISANDPESEARFLREAKLASKLQHPSIVTIYHFGVEDHSRYIVMEFVEGKTLKKIINSKPMPIAQMCELSLQIGDALAVAHEKGVVHRDMKAENVMVTPRGQVKILDFGLAKLKEPESTTGNEETAVFKTQEGLVVGTVSHMSPEQAMGGDVDARSDIFSLGVVLYEMATGEMPFNAPSAQATMAQVLNHNPAPISLLNPEVPPELDALVQQCMQKDRMLRPTAAEVVHRLKNVLATLSVRNLSAPEIRAASGSMPASPAPSAQGVAPVSAGVAAATPVSVRTTVSPAPTQQVPAAGMPSSGSAAAAQLPPVAASAKAMYYGLRAFRTVLSIALLVIPFSFLLYFVVSGGLIRPQLVEGTWVMRLMTAIVAPALRLAESVFTFRTVYQGWNFMLLGFAVVGFVFRQVVLLPIEKMENWAKTQVVRAKTAAPVAITLGTKDRRSGDRLAMLREYAEAKKSLFQEKRRLAFLSMGVIGAAQMKGGEDKLVVEHAFSEYRKFVDRALGEHKSWKSGWTADSVLAAFENPEDAMAAARNILSNLNWFNDGVHQLRTPFRLRCGLNCGDVIVPNNKAIDDINDETIDVAVALQEAAAENCLWTTRETLSTLHDQSGFQAMTMQQVNGHAIIEWRSEKRAAASR